MNIHEASIVRIGPGGEQVRLAVALLSSDNPEQVLAALDNRLRAFLGQPSREAEQIAELAGAWAHLLSHVQDYNTAVRRFNAAEKDDTPAWIEHLRSRWHRLAADRATLETERARLDAIEARPEIQHERKQSKRPQPVLTELAPLPDRPGPTSADIPF